MLTEHTLGALLQPNQNNRTRSFGEIVTLEAWHDKFDQNNIKVSLHADVVFRDGRMGGDSDSQVRFRLSIKKAEVVVIIPDSEPVKVDLTSVSRDNNDLSVQKKISQNTEQQAAVGGKASLEIGPQTINGSLEIDTSAGAKTASSHSVEATEILRRMRVIQSKTTDGHYRWEISPTVDKILEGRPWDANGVPRLKLIDLRNDRTRGIPPVVTLEVRCLREDLQISDIELKNKNLYTRLKEGNAFQNKNIAAQAYIRQRLMSEGLNFGDLSDLYAPIILARIEAISG